MDTQTNDAIEELREVVSKANNDILNLSIKYNQILSLLTTISKSGEKINSKLDEIQEFIQAIKDSSIPITSSKLSF